MSIKKNADKLIFHNLITTTEYIEAETVFCYVGTEEEIDTSFLLKHILACGKKLGVPRCIGKGIMEARRIDDFGQLRTGMYGIQEPVERCPVILPGDIDLAIVPCLTCSRDGRRLGYGGGYYDRYLREAYCRKIVLCREKMLEEKIPAEEWDLTMDIVITEKGIY